jgi:hypothetical protein
MKRILIAIGIIALLGGIIGYQMYNKPHKDIASTESDLTIKATDLLHAFETDEAAANQEYNDKLVAVTGTVSDVSREDGTIKVILDTGSPLSGVICQLDEFTDHSRTEFEVGETVTLKGMCTGYLMDVVLVRCVEVK